MRLRHRHRRRAAHARLVALEGLHERALQVHHGPLVLAHLRGCPARGLRYALQHALQQQQVRRDMQGNEGEQ